jgi:hypothetical protein
MVRKKGKKTYPEIVYIVERVGARLCASQPDENERDQGADGEDVGGENTGNATGFAHGVGVVDEFLIYSDVF